jgi:hypothetical protein
MVARTNFCGVFNFVAFNLQHSLNFEHNNALYMAFRILVQKLNAAQLCTAIRIRLCANELSDVLVGCFSNLDDSKKAEKFRRKLLTLRKRSAYYRNVTK